jgi:septal ring factor EnvC (AmiA/AmiB activator)
MGNLLPMLIESDRGQTAWAAKLPILLAVLILAGGCQRDRTPGEKQARLIAAENMQLEKQLARQQDEIDKLNKQHAKDIEKLEDRLAACQRRNERLQQDLDKGIAERADSVRDTVMAENARLRREIERLKSQSPDNP